MFRLLVILFVIRVYAQTDIFKRIKKKHGQSALKVVRKLVSVKTKFIKLQEDIKFIKTCKREYLIPSFPNVKLAIKTGNTKLKKKIACSILETELQKKHFEKRKLKKDFREINISLKSSLNVLLRNAVIHQVKIAIKSKVKSISRRHQKKLIKFRNQQTVPEKNSENNYMKHTVHNFSSYQLSEEEYKALSYGLNYHVPSKSNNNVINTEQNLKNFIRAYYLIFCIFLTINS